jgi:endonuclease YncB( thermonuclease family)
MKLKPCVMPVYALLMLVTTAAADTISGAVARVHDGDTFTLEDGTKIRAFGIDAPELNQQCRTPTGTCERVVHTKFFGGRWAEKSSWL